VHQSQVQWFIDERLDIILMIDVRIIIIIVVVAEAFALFPPKLRRKKGKNNHKNVLALDIGR
jgi:hypothetical protein